jgi:hypothetical protein
MPSDKLLEWFTKSNDTLWVYKEAELIFRSRKERLMPLLDYINAFVPRVKGVTAFDRVVGNAAALLLNKALCLEVHSPVASQAAAHTLEEFGISYHFPKIIPKILEGNDICPMEKLSLGKTSDEFYRAVTDIGIEGEVNEV